MGYQKIATRIAPLVQAVAEGKTLQFRDPKLKGMWEDVSSIGLHFYEDYEYRIKTDPLDAWRKELLDHVLEYGKQYGKAEFYYVRNDVRSGDIHSANAAEALNAFKSKLAFGPKGFK